MEARSILKRSTAILTLAGVLSAAPYHLTLGSGNGWLGLDPTLAFARNGGDDGDHGGGDDGGGHGGRDGDGGHGGGDEGGDDHGGHGGDDDGGDDHAGHGGDDDGGDDHGGRGGDDDGGDDHGGHGGDDDGGDDHGGRGGGDGDDDGARDDDGRQGRGRGSDDSTEATLADGSRIEIENGRFELKDARGRTLVERRATPADLDLLNRARAGARLSLRQPTLATPATAERTSGRGGGVVAELEVSGRNIEITYTDGWREEIENGRYELKDSRNRTVIERAARPVDRARLFAAVR